jgi:tetratricopeptide (TPR) repeat protein
VRAWAVRGVLPCRERQKAAEEAVATAQAGNDKYHELSARYHLANALLNQGRLDDAADAFVRTSEFRGGLEGWAIADFRAAHAIAQGRFAEAVGLVDTARSLGTALGDTNEGIHALQHWEIARLTGDFASAAEWQRRLMSTAVGFVLPAEPVLALDRGDVDAARTLIREWIDQIEPAVPELLRYSGLYFASLVAFGLDDVTGLEHYVDYGERFPGELLGADAGFYGAADAARGRFAAAQGRFDDAVALLEGGHALHEDLGLHQLSVESGLDLGITFARRNAPGDRERAGTLLRESEQRARTLGMTPAEQRARAHLP